VGKADELRAWHPSMAVCSVHQLRNCPRHLFTPASAQCHLQVPMIVRAPWLPDVTKGTHTKALVELGKTDNNEVLTFQS
jgi:hypothetical protein